jgi:quercetin dioxygenase-like cupin family protein
VTAWVREISEDELAPSDRMAQGLWKRFVSAEPDGRGMIFGMGCLRPGEEVAHAHEEEELFFVLKGQGEAIWETEQGEQRAELKPGVAFYKTSNIHHRMRNTGDELLVGLAFKI